MDRNVRSFKQVALITMKSQSRCYSGHGLQLHHLRMGGFGWRCLALTSDEGSAERRGGIGEARKVVGMGAEDSQDG